LVNEDHTQFTLSDKIGLGNVKDEESDEDEDMTQKKGFKAISKEMCQTIRTLNTKTNRYKRTFKCLVDGCGRTFAKSCNMAVHLRKHTGDKPYICPHAHCGKVFSQSGILSRHLKNVHKNEEKKTITIKKAANTSSSEYSSEPNQTAFSDNTKVGISPKHVRESESSNFYCL